MTISNRVLNSAIFSSSAKVIGKIIGLVSTMILARLLVPDDFGNIAIISIALYFFDVLSNVASEQYIVQKKTVTRQQLHTAWTLNLIFKTLIAVIIWSCASFIANFFERQFLKDAIVLSALVLPLEALRSPVYTLLKRQLRFKPLFWTSLLEKLFGFPVLIALAIFVKSYWAFVVTDIIVGVFGVLLSFYVAKKTPRFSLYGWQSQWHFSKWMVSKSIIGYIRSQIDTVFVSKAVSDNLVGNYHMARELVMMPAHYILAPAIEPLLSAFKYDKANLPELLNNVAFCLIVTALVVTPISLVLSVFSHQIVFLMLGPGWKVAGDLFPVLSILFVYWSILQVVETSLIAQGRLRLLFWADVVSLLIIALALFSVLGNSTELTSIALVRAISGTIATLVLTVVAFSAKPREMISIGLVSIGLVVIFYSLAKFSSELTRFNYQNESYLYALLDLIVGSALVGVIYVTLIGIVLFTCNHYHAKRLKQLINQRLKTIYIKD